MSHDIALTTFHLEAGTSIAQAQPRSSVRVTLASPALEVMTDLTQIKAATTHPTTLLRLAEQAMIYLGVRMLFVVTEMPAIEGLITHHRPAWRQGDACRRRSATATTTTCAWPT